MLVRCSDKLFIRPNPREVQIICTRSLMRSYSSHSDPRVHKLPSWDVGTTWTTQSSYVKCMGPKSRNRGEPITGSFWHKRLRWRCGNLPQRNLPPKIVQRIQEIDTFGIVSNTGRSLFPHKLRVSLVPNRIPTDLAFIHPKSAARWCIQPYHTCWFQYFNT
jgi:hypothetical protein